MICVRTSHPSYTKLIQPLHLHTQSLHCIFFICVFVLLSSKNIEMLIIYQEAKLSNIVIRVFREFLYLNLLFLPIAKMFSFFLVLVRFMLKMMFNFGSGVRKIN